MKKIFLIIFIAINFLFNCSYAKEKIETIHPEAGIYIFKINTNKYGSKIKPVITPILTTPQKVYDDNCYDLVVNGGFFDVKNGKSVSQVIINEKLTGDIEKHHDIIETLKKEDRYDKVISRSELRILENEHNDLKFDIVRHNDPVEQGYVIKHSLQAGPMILPEMDLEGEGFVVYENDVVKSQSVDILKRRERTVVGLKGKYLYIIIFTKDHKIDAVELKDYLSKDLKLQKALALDGGLSTAINYKDINIGSVGKHQRRVKSFLVIER